MNDTVTAMVRASIRTEKIRSNVCEECMRVAFLSGTIIFVLKPTEFFVSSHCCSLGLLVSDAVSSS
jgi:hypothetical protein